MTDEERDARRRYFPGLRDQDPAVIVEEASIGGWFCLAYFAADAIASGPHARGEQVHRYRVFVSANAYGHETAEKAAELSRGALVGLHAKLGRALYGDGS